MEVSVAHAPENNSTTASMLTEGSTVIVWTELVAINLNQTSSSAVPAQPTCDCDAPNDVELV